MMAGSIAFVAGVMLGFAASIPALGPLLALVAETGARRRQREGLELAIGGACAESLMVLLAFLGVGELDARLGAAFVAARLLGGTLLIAIGVLLLVRDPAPAEPDARARGSVGRMALGFAIVALNPGFLLMWTAIASAVQASSAISLARSDAAALAFGAGIGIVGWFWLVLRVAARYGRSAGLFALRRIRQAASLLVIGSGAWLAIRALLELGARGFTLSLG
jgi:threonine/homoserine/homoserine lactone efflux protein